MIFFGILVAYRASYVLYNPGRLFFWGRGLSEGEVGGGRGRRGDEKVTLKVIGWVHVLEFHLQQSEYQRCSVGL